MTFWFRFQKTTLAIFGIFLVGVLVGTKLFLVEVVQEMKREKLYYEIFTFDDPFNRGQFYFNQVEEAHQYYDINLAQQFYLMALFKDRQYHEQLWYQLGRIDFIKGDFDTALYKFNKQIEYFGDRVHNVYYMKGLTYGFRARYTDEYQDWVSAGENFEKFLLFEPNNPFALTDLAWTLFSSGRFEEMLVVTADGIQYNKDNPWLLNMHGLSLLNNKQLAEANKYFTRAAIEADNLSVSDWGRAYPGNDPKVWKFGLDEFRNAIRFNKELTASVSI